MTTQIIETIQKQVRIQLSPYDMMDLGFWAEMSEGSETLCLLFKRGGVKTNFSIKYNSATDLYDITLAKIGRGKIQQKTIEGVFCDQLGRIITEQVKA